jgi:hypothetical protein
MSTYVNRNVRGRWEKVEVTDAEVAEVTKRNFIANMNTAIECIINVRKSIQSSSRLKDEQITVPLDTQEQIALALIEKMTKPLHYDIENYVDEKLFGKEVM